MANRPVSEEESKKKKLPPKPEKSDPVALLRWQLKYDPAVPAWLRMSDEQVEEHCDNFRKKLESGEITLEEDEV